MQSLSVREFENRVEITTPCLDRHNDYIQVWVNRDLSEYYISDGGYTLIDLSASGCDIKCPSRVERIDTIARRLDVQLDGQSLEVRTDKRHCSVRMHQLIQAMLVIGNLFYSDSNVDNEPFELSVRIWLDSLSVQYESPVTYTGKSGFDHRFHVVISDASSRAKQVVVAVGNLDRSNV